VNLDVDGLYRKVLPGAVQGIDTAMTRAAEACRTKAARLIVGSAAQLRTLHAPPGVLGDPWSIGRATLWAAVLLVVMLLVAYW